MRATSLISILFSLLLIVLIGGGCVGDLETFDPMGGGGGGGGGAGPDAGGSLNSEAKTYFDTNVAPLIRAQRANGACMVCHQGQNLADGPDFLGPTAADNYLALTGDTRLIGPTAATSVFVNKGAHTGNAFCTGPGTPDATCTADEVGIISQWIALEAAK